MGIKMNSYHSQQDAHIHCKYAWASQCDAYFHSGMLIFTLNIGIGMPIFT